MSEWIDALKPGDEVIVGGRVAVVERRTPTGRIVVNGIQYMPNGSRRGDFYSRIYLQRATPEAVKTLKDKIFVRNVINGMRSAVNELTYEQAVAINEIFGFVKGDTKNEMA